jgi:hypothetical protein
VSDGVQRLKPTNFLRLTTQEHDQPSQGCGGEAPGASCVCVFACVDGCVHVFTSMFECVSV